MADGIARITVWTFVAFWLYLPLVGLLRTLRLPLPHVGAAILSWIGAGVLLPWVPPVIFRWMGSWWGILHGLLLIH